MDLYDPERQPEVIVITLDPGSLIIAQLVAARLNFDEFNVLGTVGGRLPGQEIWPA
jgi:hypothetical protein